MGTSHSRHKHGASEGSEVVRKQAIECYFSVVKAIMFYLLLVLSIETKNEYFTYLFFVFSAYVVYKVMIKGELP